MGVFFDAFGILDLVQGLPVQDEITEGHWDLAHGSHCPGLQPPPWVQPLICPELSARTFQQGRDPLPCPAYTLTR